MKETTKTMEEQNDLEEPFWFCKGCKHDELDFGKVCETCNVTIRMTNYET